MEQEGVVMGLTTDGRELCRIAYEQTADGVFQLPSGRFIARCGRKLSFPYTKEEAENAFLDWKLGDAGPEPFMLMAETKAEG